MGKDGKRKGLRIALISALALTIITGGVAIWFSSHYKSIIRERLPGMVAKATDSLYLISLKDISVNLLSRKVAVSGVRLYADSSRAALLKAEHRLPHTLFDIAIPGAEARGISLTALLRGKELHISQLLVRQPEITVLPQAADSADTMRKKRESPALEQVRIEQVHIMQPRVHMPDSATGDSTSYFAGGEILLTGWTLDTSEERDTSRVFFAKSCRIRLDSFILSAPHSMYRFRTGALSFDSREGKLSVGDLSLRPAVSKQEFYRQTGHQKEIYTLNFPSVSVEGLNWRELLEKQHVLVSHITMQDPDLDIFMNRIYPPNPQSKMGKFPHQLLQKLSFSLDIRSLDIRNGNFRYTEVNDKTKRAGELPIRRINGTISNITNIPAAVLDNPVCLIGLRGLIMGNGNLTAEFRLFLNSKEGAFTVKGRHGPMDGKRLNPVMHSLALAQVESMQLDGIDLFVEGNERIGHGRFTIRYHDLNVKLEGVDDDGKMETKGLLSFFANAVMVHTDNPAKGKPVRSVTTEVRRDPYKSFFNLIWKNIFNGALKTAIRNESMVDNINRRQTKHEEERKKEKK